MNLAPNGKPSNLTPEQYRLVRTPAFKKWFGDWEKNPKGKFIDENGEPKVFYHFGDNKWNKIKDKTIRGGEEITGRIFFAPQKYDLFKNVVQYQIKYEKDNKINTDFTDNAKKYTTREFFIRGDIRKLKYENRYKKTLSTKNSHLVEYNEAALKSANKMHKYIYKKKHKFENYFIIVTNSNNIKLADGSNTTFSSKKADIRYADGGYLSETLTIDEVENLLGRKLHWWKDDVVSINGVEYKKLFLKSEYKII